MIKTKEKRPKVFDNGKTIKEMADEFNVTKQAMASMIVRNGVELAIAKMESRGGKGRSKLDLVELEEYTPLTYHFKQLINCGISTEDAVRRVAELMSQYDDKIKREREIILMRELIMESGYDK